MDSFSLLKTGHVLGCYIWMIMRNLWKMRFTFNYCHRYLRCHEDFVSDARKLAQICFFFKVKWCSFPETNKHKKRHCVFSCSLPSGCSQPAAILKRSVNKIIVSSQTRSANSLVIFIFYHNPAAYAALIKSIFRILFLKDVCWFENMISFLIKDI